MNQVKNKKKEKKKLEKRRLQGNDEEMGDQFDNIFNKYKEKVLKKIKKVEVGERGASF